MSENQKIKKSNEESFLSQGIWESMIIIDSGQVSRWDKNYIEELKKGGVTAVNVNSFSIGFAREALSYIGKWYTFIKENSDQLMLIKNGEDILKAKKLDKIGIILGTQNSTLLEDDISLVEVYKNLGVNIMQLTYNNQNLVGSSCYEKNDSGLSRFGELVIQEMNRVGMIIDLSHVGEKTMSETIDKSRRPVAITHGNPDWVFDYKKRNKSKEILTKLKENNGMIGLTVFPRLMNGDKSTIDDFCKLVSETVDLMGIDKVGIGTDLTLNKTAEDNKWVRMGRWALSPEDSFGATASNEFTWPKWPSWFSGPADFPTLAEGLYKAGFNEKDIISIMGKNWHEFIIEGVKGENYSS